MLQGMLSLTFSSPQGARSIPPVDSHEDTRKLERSMNRGDPKMLKRNGFWTVVLWVTLAFGASFPVAAQKAKDESPDLKRAREALDKYKDPVAAIHDGYFSTLGCVTYPKPGAPGH